MTEKLKVRIARASIDNDQHAWATPAEDGNGYTLEWDDGYKEHANTRWFFEGDGIFNLEEVK